MNAQEPIAERVIYALDKHGRGFDIGLQVGSPYMVETPLAVWRCPVAMIGLHGRFPDMYGDDSWQALVLAVDLIEKLLTSFVDDDGGKLYYEKGGPEIDAAEAFGIPYREPQPDPPLTPEQVEQVALLTNEQLEAIDAAILKECSHQFRKVARVAGFALGKMQGSIQNVPDLYYAERVRKLVAEGRLESQGNLNMMGYSEVRLPE